MFELKRILREIEEEKRAGHKKLFIDDEISPSTRLELEQLGYMVLAGWSRNHIIYIVGWK